MLLRSGTASPAKSWFSAPLHTPKSQLEVLLLIVRKNQSTANPLTPFTTTAKMGRVRTKTVKKSAKVIIERYYPKLTLDFETNKRICDEIAVIASKRLRNKVRNIQRDAGHLGSSVLIVIHRLLDTPPT